MPLSLGQVASLRNLRRKHGGEAVDFINIANAVVLTEMGLARRGRAGWEITADGLAALGLEDGDADPPCKVVTLPPLQ